MGLNTKYIPTKYMQEDFIDKISGEPLANGKVYFWRDSARTTPKEVFQLSGSPPNYTYTSLGTTLTLSSVGTFVDSFGNDIVPYFYPYDANDDLDLYYVEIKDSGDVLQFVREGQPNVEDLAEEQALEMRNYINNGQYTLHVDRFDTDGLVVLSDDIFRPASGGWIFKKTSTSTAKDYITFEKFSSPPVLPPSSPLYSARIRCTDYDVTDTIKYWGYRFFNVNTFASDTITYTRSFAAKSNSGSPLTVKLIVVKNYGEGGSSEETIEVQDITIGTAWSIFNVPVIFGSNDGKIIGNTTDYLDIAIRFPTNNTFDINVVNEILTDGDVEIEQFPNTTYMQTMWESVYGRSDEFFDYRETAETGIKSGLNQYIGTSPILTSYGMEWDTYTTGFVYPTSGIIVPFPYVLADGTVYFKNGYKIHPTYTDQRIPYYRLFSMYYIVSGYITRWGSGAAYVQVSTTGYPTIRVTCTANGATTSAADGSNPTGFTFTDVQPGTPTQPYIVDITTVAATSIPAGAYFTYHTPDGKKYILWYKKNNVGSQPTETADYYIERGISSSYSNHEMADITYYEINTAFFAVPDWRGMFLRMMDGGAGIDPDAGARTAPWSGGIAGDNIGTVQQDDVKPHTHPLESEGVFVWTSSGSTHHVAGKSVGSTGANTGSESRPKNVYINYLIKL